jgi:hypothetical protein
LLSLCCLLPGRYNYATCMQMKLPDRALMVKEAVDLARTTLKIERSKRGTTNDDMDTDPF